MPEVLFTIDQERAQAERAGMSVGISSSEILLCKDSPLANVHGGVHQGILPIVEYRLPL